MFEDCEFALQCKIKNHAKRGYTESLKRIENQGEQRKLIKTKTNQEKLNKQRKPKKPKKKQ